MLRLKSRELTSKSSAVDGSLMVDDMRSATATERAGMNSLLRLVYVLATLACRDTKQLGSRGLSAVEGGEERGPAGPPSRRELLPPVDDEVDQPLREFSLAILRGNMQWSCDTCGIVVGHMLVVEPTLGGHLSTGLEGALEGPELSMRSRVAAQSRHDEHCSLDVLGSRERIVDGRRRQVRLMLAQSRRETARSLKT